jgi:FkbM family methyltransferase
MHHTEIVDALRALSPRKQALVLETFPGLEGETPLGLKVVARTGKELGRFRNAGDPNVIEWLRGFEPGEVFYDIGANCGGITLAAAALHRDSIRIVAIEPSFASFESLARNLSLNGLLPSAIPLQLALLDRTGLEPLNYRSTAAGTSLHAVGKPVDHEGNAFTPVEVQLMPTFTLDDLIEVLELPAPTRIKIDVDGYEEPVLRGAALTLAEGTIIDLMVEVVDHDRAGSRLAALSALLADADYRLAGEFRHGEDGYVYDYLFRRHGSTRPSTRQEKAFPAVAVRRAEGRAARASERHAADEARLARQAEKLEELANELAVLRRSYYLSGAGGKIDLREIAGFSAIAERETASGRTGMDYDRLYVLWQAARAAPPELAVAEVGVYRGGSARFLAETLRYFDRAPRFYVCDTFAGHPRTDPELDPVHHGSNKFQDTSVEDVAGYLVDFPNVELVVGDIVDTQEQLAHERFGFVHVDVDVHPATESCLGFFAPRLAVGGSIVVDDYGVLTCPGVQRAVDEFAAESPAFRLFHSLTGQALLVKVGEHSEAPTTTAQR